MYDRVSQQSWSIISQRKCEEKLLPHFGVFRGNRYQPLYEDLILDLVPVDSHLALSILIKRASLCVFFFFGASVVRLTPSFYLISWSGRCSRIVHSPQIARDCSNVSLHREMDRSR